MRIKAMQLTALGAAADRQAVDMTSVVNWTEVPAEFLHDQPLFSVVVFQTHPGQRRGGASHTDG